MNALLLQLDGGKFPNLALMRISAHHKAKGDTVTFRRAEAMPRIAPQFGDSFEYVYASAIFLKSRPLCEEVRKQWGEDALIGGTGWSLTDTLEAHGIETAELDYTFYPHYRHSIGFTQRGCRLQCEFCVVPQKEGRVREAQGVMGIWRGDPWPRNLVLLDNDFFGSPHWKSKIEVIRRENFRVSFNQGINARCLTDEAAEAIATVRYSDDDFTCRRIYTAWDSRKDEERLFKGLNALVRYGVKPHHIMVYMLIGYWPGETHADREYRRARLRDFGALPFPMAYTDDPELKGFQRWVIRHYDKAGVSWKVFTKARFQPANIGFQDPAQFNILYEPEPTA